jgi:hypothetical protein
MEKGGEEGRREGRGGERRDTLSNGLGSVGGRKVSVGGRGESRREERGERRGGGKS